MVESYLVRTGEMKAEFIRRCGVPRATFFRFLKTGSISLDNWDKIEAAMKRPEPVEPGATEEAPA